MSDCGQQCPQRYMDAKVYKSFGGLNEVPSYIPKDE
jgi:hypothetical protein